MMRELPLADRLRTSRQQPDPEAEAIRNQEPGKDGLLKSSFKLDQNPDPQGYPGWRLEEILVNGPSPLINRNINTWNILS